MAIIFNKQGRATKGMSLIIGIVVLAVGVLSLLNRFGVLALPNAPGIALEILLVLGGLLLLIDGMMLSNY